MSEVESKATKYDWSKAPAEATHCATDADGYAYWFNKKPKICLSAKNWGQVEDLIMVAYWQGESPFKGDWRDSLEERPEGV